MVSVVPPTFSKKPQNQGTTTFLRNRPSPPQPCSLILTAPSAISYSQAPAASHRNGSEAQWSVQGRRWASRARAQVGAQVRTAQSSAGGPRGSHVISLPQPLQILHVSARESPDMYVHAESLSRVRFFAAPWIVAYPAPLFMDSPGRNTGMGRHALLHQEES